MNSSIRALGHKRAGAVRNRLVTKMSAEQINEAQGRVRKWLAQAQSRPQRTEKPG